MKKTDGRKLDHQTLEAIRIRAVTAVQNGESPEAVIATMGMTRSLIYRWLSAYHSGGIEALKAKKLFGRPPRLDSKQMKWIYKTVVGKNPLQLRFEFALWTRDMIRDLIKREFQVSMTPTSVGRMLGKLGLTCQKPLHRAYQKDGIMVSKWIEIEYPKIVALAKRQGAKVFFGDEAGIRSDYHRGTTWGLKGQTPRVTTTGARFGLNMVSAISPRGEIRFMIQEGTVTADVFCDFLKRLVHNATKPVFLIVDGHPIHRSAKAKELLQSLEGKLRMFYLPSYSPELNPDELVWNNVKGNIGKSMITGPDHLNKLVLSQLRSLQKLPEKIRGFFREKYTAYTLCNVY